MKRLIKVIFFLIVFISFLSVIYSTSFVLKRKTVVFDNVVKMKDIAMMDNHTMNKIGNLIISSSPNIGNGLIIGKREVFEKLIGNGVSNPILKGAKRVFVSRKGKIVNMSYFKDKILKYVRKYSKWKEGISIKIKTNKKIIVPSIGVSWKIIPVNGQDFFGNILFKIRAFKNNEEIFSDWIIADLTVEKKVALANRTISKDEMIGETDIRWEEREITPFIKNAVFNKGQIIGRRAGRTIRTNTVITANNLESKYLVRRGMLASLIVNYKSIRAIADVIPLSYGKYGDYIKVMNKSTRKILTALVVGRNKMEVKVR